ncbi:MAG: amino acid carrier protein [Bacteroidales bacterium]|nr:amino acid carrier protein [Bacteroidales bacterium]
MIKSIFNLIIFSIIGISTFAQGRGTFIEADTTFYPLEVELQINNKTKDINDGFVIANVSGGITPYHYYWSKEDISLNSSIGQKLTEGQKYTLIVRDSNGDSLVNDILVPSKSLNEKFNSALVPAVNFMAKFIMADVFAMLNIYDPVLKDENGEILRHPNGDPMKMNIPIIVVWLILGALFFTIYLGFINFRGFKLAIQHVAGKFDKKETKGEVSHFQALTTALSATVGLGNIAGVAIAISIGGPGATLWMIIAGLLGMSTKFVECTLGVKYRDINKDGVVSGGPMYYMNKAFKNRKMGGFGKILAGVFAVLIIGGSFGGGNMFQANQAFAQVSNMFPALSNFGALFGVILAILVGTVVLGGIKSIAKVTDKIVPFMALFYVIVALIIIIINFKHTGEAFSLIWNGAFGADALKGGIIGVMIVGFQRAAFSNEAGVGSASVAHSAVKTNEPVTEGLVALLEPFIDTVVICTMTALVIIYTGFYSNPTGLDGVELTSAAFGSVFSWFPYLLILAIMLFAFSTMISWSYYGLNGFKYLFGKYIKNDKTTRNIYYTFFLLFIVIGSASSLGAVIDFSDMMILSMAFPNIIALYVLSREVKGDLKTYLKKIKK